MTPAAEVVICGGGLAGLTLARQLRRTLPELEVVVIDQQPRPLPPAAHKVGESSVETGTHYFHTRLDLADYLKARHLPKLGLRFFFGDARGPLGRRPEFGASKFPSVPSFQLDRGVLEDDLRGMVEEAGARLIEGASVRDIALSETGEPHEVTYVADGRTHTLRARWVVDAMGRRRFLQSRLGLGRPSGHGASAAWWRLKGIYDLEKMDPKVSRRWLNMTSDPRWYSTNHLMGRGYWCWLIPLGSRNMSIGIVTDESIHPVATYNSHARAMDWLRAHEPALATFLGDAEPMDFLLLRNFSYWSEQVFSHHRWSCVGIAGVFTDPFYSPGSDFIAYSNTITTRLIQHDLDGTLDRELVDRYNRFYLTEMGENTLEMYRDNYPAFGSARVMIPKIVWDTCYTWAFPTQLFFRQYFEPEVIAEYVPIAGRFLGLQRRVQKLFRDWAARLGEGGREDYRFVEYSDMPFYRHLQQELVRPKPADEMLKDMRRHLDRFEEWAQVIFRQAIRDCMPERLAELPDPLWVDAWVVGLEPDRWQADGLFSPASPPRSVDGMEMQMARYLLDDQKLASTTSWRSDSFARQR